MNQVDTYISNLPALTDEELKKERATISGLLTKAIRGHSPRRAENLEKMFVGVISEANSRGLAITNPSRRKGKRRSAPKVPDDFPITRLPPGPTPKLPLTEDGPMAGRVYGGLSSPGPGRALPKKVNPKKKAKKRSKRGMSTAGRAAAGAGIGALALGPVGAVGLGYAATRYKPVKANPKRNPDRLVHTEKTDPFDIRLYDYGDGKYWYQIYDPGFGEIVAEDHDARSEKDAIKSAINVINNELLVSNKGRRSNPPGSSYRVQVRGNYFSVETGNQPVKQILIIEAKTKDEARKKAQSRMVDLARKIGYEFDGKHKEFKAEKLTSNPGKSKSKKKASPSKALISKAQKLWGRYVERPGKRRLKDVFEHLGKMELSAAKSVKDELRRAKRAAKAEAKRLKLKV